MNELKKAIRAARKNVKILPDKTLNKNLECCCGSLADAYRLGAMETQSNIVDRLLLLNAPKPSILPNYEKS